MARPIKFRAWHKMYKRMFYVSQIDFRGDGILYENLDDFDSDSHCLTMCELMQFTGLHDKEGKEIYEGDIFKRNDHYGFVYFSLNSARFKIEFDDGKIVDLAADSQWSWWIFQETCIGNKFEHPHLLEKI